MDLETEKENNEYNEYDEYGGEEDKVENETEIEVEETADENRSKLQLTIAEAVRPPQRGDLEQLVASELALAVMSANPLQKIRHCLEAYMLLPEDVRKQISETLEMDEWIPGALYHCCISFLNIVEMPQKPTYIERFISIPWSFPLDESSDYLFWISRVWLVDEQLVEELRNTEDKEKRRELWNQYLKALYKYLSSGISSEIIVKHIQNEFIVFAQPIISRIMRAIFTYYVTKQTWQDAFSLVRGGKRQS